MGLDFLSLAFVNTYNAKLVQSATQKLLTFLKHFAALFTHIQTEMKGMVREGQLRGGVEGRGGVHPPRGTAATVFSLCVLVNMHMRNWSNLQ